MVPSSVRFFVGFTSSSAFRYSARSIARSKNFQAMPRNSLFLPPNNGPHRFVDVERPGPPTAHFKEIDLQIGWGGPFKPRFWLEWRPIFISKIKKLRKLVPHRS